MAPIIKDWHAFDAERGAGQKTGRVAGTLAGIAGASKFAPTVFSALKRTGLKRVPRLGLAAVGAYGAYQGAKAVGGYLGRKIDEATARVFKEGPGDDMVGPGFGTALGNILNPDAPARPRPKMAPGMVQGRGRANAGPSRSGQGPDIIKVHASKHAKAKLNQTFHEYGQGALHSGSKHGPVVTSHDQAVAIALSQAGLSRNG